MLKRMPLFSANRPVEVVRYWRDNGDLLLTPPYQRGDVWGTIRRRNLIRSIIIGVPVPSIIINDRMKADWPNDDFAVAVIDGKQRLTAILMFFDGSLSVPGEWFGDFDGMITFPELPIVSQRKFKSGTLAFSEGASKTIEEETEVFELVNFGGVPQGESDTE